MNQNSGTPSGPASFLHSGAGHSKHHVIRHDSFGAVDFSLVTDQRDPQLRRLSREFFIPLKSALRSAYHVSRLSPWTVNSLSSMTRGTGTSMISSDMLLKYEPSSGRVSVGTNRQLP